jgi:hypothetical protein
LPGVHDSSWPTGVRNVLILAREEVVAALLGLMVELHGFQPKFVDRSERVDDVIQQERPGAVLIDCDHPDCTDALIQTIRRLDATRILFSPFRMQHEVRSAWYTCFSCTRSVPTLRLVLGSEDVLTHHSV